MHARIRVIIATTEGPSIVRRVGEEDPIVRSVICLDGTTRALGVSTGYDAFVRSPTGVVERDVGHSAFRVDVSAPIDEGESWQLGLYVAHRLAKAGRLAEGDEAAELTLWASGRVNRDLEVLGVDRVAEKLRRSQEVFQQSGNVIVAVSQENSADLPENATATNVTFRALRSVGAFVDELLQEASSNVPAAETKTAKSGLAKWGAILALLVFAAGAYAFWQQGGLPQLMQGPVAPEGERVEETQPQPPATETTPGSKPALETGEGSTIAEPPAGIELPFDPETIVLEVVEHLPRPEKSCRSGADAHLGSFEAPTRTGVCQLTFRLRNTGKEDALVWLSAEVSGGFRSYSKREVGRSLASQSLAAGQSVSVDVDLPHWVRKQIEVEVIVSVAEGNSATRPEVETILNALEPKTGLTPEIENQLKALNVAFRKAKYVTIPSR